MPKSSRFVAQNEHGDWCGHWHRYFDRACQCARSQERYYRVRYSERQEWRTHRFEADLTKAQPRAVAA